MKLLIKLFFTFFFVAGFFITSSSAQSMTDRYSGQTEDWDKEYVRRSLGFCTWQEPVKGSVWETLKLLNQLVIPAPTESKTKVLVEAKPQEK